MPVVVGIRFKDSGKIYYFDPDDTYTLNPGDHVIVDTVRGPELARVALGPKHVDPEEIVGDLKPVIRRAEDADFERMRVLNARQSDVLARCNEKIREHGLPMRLVKSEYSFDGSRLTFYFTSEKRVDFRLLVRDLARTFKTRIELRQIGPRDEAKLLGGIGPCGRLLCCSTFLPDYARVSIKMAKDQDLPLNPTKISGVCGRLLCCLAYEHEQYVEIKAELPRKGAWVQTPDGPGEVVAVNVVKETVQVLLAASGIQETFAPEQLSEATARVAQIARERNEEQITPATATQERQPARRERRQSGERRLLRESIDSPEVIEALRLLDTGFDVSDLDDRAITPPQERRTDSVGGPRSEPGRASARSQAPASRRRGSPPTIAGAPPAREDRTHRGSHAQSSTPVSSAPAEQRDDPTSTQNQNRRRGPQTQPSAPVSSALAEQRDETASPQNQNRRRRRHRKRTDE